MDRYIRHTITFDRGERTTYEVDAVLSKFYERGDIENVTIDCQLPTDKTVIRFESSTDDFIAVQNELKNHGIEFT